MRPESTRYVICYDVADEKRRLCLARCLDGYGDRVQFSVFEAVLDHALAQRMVEEVKAIIVKTEDRVSVFALCAACARQVLRLGKHVDVPGEEIVFVV
jgi:CRISPR-associated protein Cas2